VALWLLRFVWASPASDPMLMLRLAIIRGGAHAGGEEGAWMPLLLFH
jgi:hypothetical protein